MTKPVILTEKPSVAKQFAEALRATKKDGYFESNDYIITYTFGHLLQIDDSALPKQWKWQDLPIPLSAVNNRFTIIKDKKTKKTDAGALKQFNVIKSLLQNTGLVINAGDAGREGELIQRLVMLKSGYKGRVLRLWTSEALTGQVIQRELKNGLKDGREFDSLYYAALARTYGDFAVGINLTRAVSLLGKQLLRVGRVQTPTLYFVYKRHQERKNFKPEDYYIIKGTFEKDGIQYDGMLVLSNDENKNADDKDKEIGSRLKKETAERIMAEIGQDVRTAVVVKKMVERKTELPPLLHCLTSLQREANQMYGFTAQKTLNIVQKLYEPPICAVSYPRTDAQHLGDTNRELVKEVLKALGQSDKIPIVDRLGKRMFDSSKLTDHHALIPLKKLPDNCSEDEKKIYNLIYRKFMGHFLGDYMYDRTTVFTKVKNYSFKTVVDSVVRAGWKALYDKSEIKKLPDLKENDRVNTVKITSEKKQTQPPPLYTEASLLKDMERMNLGTPATRASIIETLKQSSYMYLVGKNIDITPKGIDLIELMINARIPVYQPELTSEWEKQLESIYREKQGYNGMQRFLSDLYNKFIVDSVNKVKNSNAVIKRAPTPKMVNFAKVLAQKNKVKLEKEVMYDYEKCKEFISRYVQNNTKNKNNDR